MEIKWASLGNIFEDLEEYDGKWWIISPYLTQLPPLDSLDGIKVLTRGEPLDFIQGISSAVVLQELIQRGAEIRALSNLNSKVYLREGEKNFVGCIGSPNLTNGGFKTNIEVITGPTELNTEFIAELHEKWGNARQMTQQEISVLLNMTRFSKPWLRNSVDLTFLKDTTTSLKGAGDLISETFSHINEAFVGSENTPNTIPFGFVELDMLTGGLEPGTLTIIAARPAMGKSSLALTIAANCLLRTKIPVLICSLEMTALQVTTRMLGSEARVNMSRVRLGMLSDRDFQRLADVAGRMVEVPLFVDEVEELSIEQLAINARVFAQEHKAPFLLIVDYVQLMSSSSNIFGSENRHQEIAKISRGLKLLARELKIPIIALSQLSRAVESRPNKRPLLTDLRESGQLEEDADLILFIYRDEYYDPQSEKQGIAEVIVGKQRNGPVGTVELQFHSAHVRFNDLARTV